MKNIQEIVEAVKKNDYDIEDWDFQGQEPADCKQRCQQWFNRRSTKYKLSQISIKVIDDDFILIVDFRDALNEYWDKEGYSIASAYYAVTLNV